VKTNCRSGVSQHVARLTAWFLSLKRQRRMVCELLLWQTAMRLSARLYQLFVTASGCAVLAFGICHWHSTDFVRYLSCLAIALLASGLKVHPPAVTGAMSVNFVLILIGISDMSLSEALTIGCGGMVSQYMWRASLRKGLDQVLFNTGSTAIAVGSAYAFCHSGLESFLGKSTPGFLILVGSMFFAVFTASAAGLTSIAEGTPFVKTWREQSFWSFPYYPAGATIAWLVTTITHHMPWQATILLPPVIYFIYRSYWLYLGHLEEEKKHVEEMAGLHLRTIEALALAIEAKDNTTHDHLRRVSVYAIEVGKELGLEEAELQGLRAAALLHDIGKLAIPEHIISKPGKLTPEEFEKLKIHPVVGAEILDRVQFPYPVVPLVRAHHEKWDGSGYPAGLKGEEIPIGARILAVVDCLDALASDRQYRRAYPLDQAMEMVAAESGKSFDARIVEILKRRYVELERIAQSQPLDRARLSTSLKITRGTAPAAGFQHSRPIDDIIEPLASIAAARQEVQMLFELTQDLGNSLSLNETLSVVAVRLKRLIPYDAIAVFICRENILLPEYVNGENFRALSSAEIPVGLGLSGWVAGNKKPILNGDPAVDAGAANDASKFNLRSALAVPLEGLNGTVGVLTLYRTEKDAFSQDHLRILLAISSKISLSIENALKYRQIESSATTDYLTNLPNARSLFLHLDGELARCKRMNLPLAVLVCDLDGFKQINDRFGHLEGNRVLRFVANGLRDKCRAYDYVARMGGDEFVVLLPGAKSEVAEEKIAQLREVALQAGTLIRGADFLSLSVGAAFYPEDAADAEQLLAEADRRMYKTKQEQKRERPELLPEIGVLTATVQ
jgi:diguanylate cyclase (GGDEF)-like protein/putative nucleotidyltransferase with HDIG domain